MTLTQALIERVKQWEIDLVTIADARRIHTRTYTLSKDPPYRCGQKMKTEVEPDVFDPKVILPQAESVVMLGSYMYGLDHILPTTPEKPRGKIGPWTRIYTDISEQMANIVIDFLAERGYKGVFTNDLPYRTIAAQTSMGKIGRNHFLYTKAFGSYLRLGCVVTDARLETTYVDYEFTDNDCGHCRLCEKSCPTSAMREDGVLLYDHCLHQLLQGKGEARDGLPREYWNKTESYLMRTGKCLEVCRYNRKLVPRPSIPRFVKVFDDIDKPDSPELIPLVMATDAEIEALVPKNVWKYGKNNIRQNAILALGQQKAEKAVPALQKCVISCSNSQNACMAAWALGEIGSQESMQAIEQALLLTKEQECKAELHRSLANRR